MSGQGVEHLWLLITNPHPQTHEAIMVNVTTLRPDSDKTMVLDVGDHPFIKKPSIIFYADARAVNVHLLDDALRRGTFRPHAPFAATLVARIQVGLTSSPFTPKKIKTAYAGYVSDGLA